MPQRNDLRPGLAGPAPSSLCSNLLTRRGLFARGAALTGTVMFGEGVLVEDDPRVSHFRRTVRGLRAPVRLVQLTDLHRSWCVSEAYLKRVVDQANALRPDVALLTGDFVTDSSGYMASCLSALKQLQAPRNYAVLGNHDYGCDEQRGGPAITEALRSIGTHVLTNRSDRLDCGLHVVGVDDCWKGNPDPELAFNGVPANAPALIMTHNPEIFSSLCRYEGITVAGHTHGGQVNVPIVTSQLMSRRNHYIRGWYRTRHGPGDLFVSRGIGVVGIPIRVRCDPEIALFELVPA